MSKRAIIIGAGLGGLLCARILSRKGLDVTVLEAADVPGGLLHSVDWDGIPCEQGFHSVGGLAPGETLEKIFRSLGLMDLPWYRADADEGFPFLRLNADSELEKQHILQPYQQSVWRLKGGGDTLANALADGLDIRYGKCVVSIDNQVITCRDNSSFKADVIIADLPPHQCLKLVKDHIRHSFIHRLDKLEMGRPIFTLYCLLEPGCVKWQSGAIFLDRKLMIHFAEPETGILELLCFGEESPEKMLSLARTRLPGLKVTKYRSTLFPGYGILKHTGTDYLSARTPLPYLYLTGQNIGLHGILGTAVSALNTCKSIRL